MMLLEVDTPRITILEFKCDAPRAIHMNTVAFRLASQGVKVKSGQVHVIGDICCIEAMSAPAMNSSATSRW